MSIAEWDSTAKVTMTTLISALLLTLALAASHAEARAMVDAYSPVFFHKWKVVPDDDDGGTSSRSSGLSAAQIQEIVDHHNQLRAAEGASNMEVMRWNSKLAELAQKWSDGCEFDHGQPPFDAGSLGYESLGQNLYVNSDLGKGMRAGVQAWFDEKSDYNYDSLTCAPGKQCGHYTQVVWGTSKEVGCGLTKCSSVAGMSNANYLVCNYGPPGNWDKQKPFKKGAACSECNSGKFFCSKNLCDSSCTGSGSTCKCAAQCGKCGTKTSDCKCECKPGWTGVACNEECKNTHEYCGGNPGWPKSWCDSAHQYVLDKCPKFCGLCQGASGGQTCSLRASWRDTFDVDKSEEQQGQLADAISKLREKLMTAH